MEIGLKRLVDTSLQEQRQKRKMIVFSALFVLLLFCFTLCLRTTRLGLIPPLQEIKNLAALVRIFFADLLQLPGSLKKSEVIASYPLLLETAGRLKSTALTAVAGASLSLAGAVYQNVFRNPIAVPSMLGVSGGVNLGMLILVWQYSTSAVFMTVRAAIYCYAASFVILLAVVAYGRFLGGKKFSTVEMLLAGSILARIIMEAVNFMNGYLSDEELTVLQELFMNGFGFSGSASVVLFAASVIFALFPLFLMRFSMNAVCFPQEEARTLGLNTFGISVLSLLCGTVLVITTVMYSGDISMLALMVPHISRYLFGVNFKNQYYSCLLFGAGFLLICRIITIVCSFSRYTQVFTLGTVVSLLTGPVFMMVLSKGRRGWE